MSFDYFKFEKYNTTEIIKVIIVRTIPLKINLLKIRVCDISPFRPFYQIFYKPL